MKQQLNDNRPLYLYKNEMKAIKLKNCGNKDNKLQCNIDKGDIYGIIGFSGAGKSTLAETIEKKYKIPRLCLDNVHFLTNGIENNKEDDILFTKTSHTQTVCLNLENPRI